MNFVEIKAFGNFKLEFTLVNEDFKFSSNAEIDEIGLFRLDSFIVPLYMHELLVGQLQSSWCVSTERIANPEKERPYTKLKA